jgi:hypothetical protein
MPFHYNPANVEVLRIQTESLCAKLGELHAGLQNGTFTLKGLKDDYSRLYQPEAVALAEAMRHHLPGNDSQQNPLSGGLSDMPTLLSPLVTTTQMLIISRILRRLAASLPKRVTS